MPEQATQYPVDARALTRRLVAIDSTDPGAFEGGVAGYLQGWFAAHGLPCQSSEVLPGRCNLRAVVAGKPVGGAPLPPLAFICHMDTVPVNEGWRHEPFGAAVEDELLYGRGACDMKAGLACALSALYQAARRGGGARALSLICTVDEEDRMRGAEKALADGWIAKDTLLLDAEPTDGCIQVSHKGRVWVALTCTGQAAHASMPWQGADAVAGMAEAICRMRRAVSLLPTHRELGETTITFGRIDGGEQPYAVPGACTVWLDIRPVPPTDLDALLASLRFATEQAAAEVPGVRFSWQVTGNRPAIQKDDRSPLLHALRAAVLEATGVPPRVTPFTGYTDTAVAASALGSINCMSYGPGSLRQAHKPDEYVPLDDIQRCEAVFWTLTRQLLAL